MDIISQVIYLTPRAAFVPCFVCAVVHLSFNYSARDIVGNMRFAESYRNSLALAIYREIICPYRRNRQTLLDIYCRGVREKWMKCRKNNVASPRISPITTHARLSNFRLLSSPTAPNRHSTLSILTRSPLFLIASVRGEPKSCRAPFLFALSDDKITSAITRRDSGDVRCI